MNASVGKGSSFKIIEYKKNLGEAASEEVVNGVYYYYYFDCSVKYDDSLEMTDRELRGLAVKSGAYDFWNMPEEDIYTLRDGEPV